MRKIEKCGKLKCNFYFPPPPLFLTLQDSFQILGDSPHLETEQVGQELDEEPVRDAETGESSQPQTVKNWGLDSGRPAHPVD